jgi:GH24 family phage-related lysozyme (muramidase)
MFSDRALQLIFEFEGLNQPGTWPGGFSGVTLGIGYDLGYVTMDQFESDWGERIGRPAVNRLRVAVGLRGPRARGRAHEFADIRVRRPPSELVFIERTLPLTALRTAQAFPGFEALPLDAQGALVSLVYNRGASMIDRPGEDRRREMRAVRRAVAEGDLPEIARQIRSMQRLWVGRGLDGLIRRRDAEAALVESCA